MIIPDEVVAGFFFLSQIDDEAVLQSEYESLKDKMFFIPDAYRGWFQFFQEYYQNYDSFPSWERVKSQMGLENEVSLSVQDARDIFYKNLAVWESDALAAKLVSAPLAERRGILARMSSVLSVDTAEDVPLSSTASFSLDGTVIRSKKSEERHCVLFTKHLNDLCIVNPGTTISIIGAPGAGKTQCSLNIVYLNSILGFCGPCIFTLKTLRRRTILSCFRGIPTPMECLWRTPLLSGALMMMSRRR
jgi:hypothetical protein